MKRLGPDELREEQAKTFAAAPMRYSPMVWMFFLAMDLLYGRARTWSKFKVLEVIRGSRIRPGNT